MSSVQKDSTWLRRDLKNGYYLWGKQNPEYYIYQGYWNDILYHYNTELISNFGYESGLGCPYCMKTGRIPKTLVNPLSCGLDENFSETKTCTITISVIPRTKLCLNGHTYNLNSDGSDPGCPYCKAWLRSLELVEPASGSITIDRGTSLSDNGVSLLAVYLDGRTEYLTEGYIDNLDKQYVGAQIVTIGYKGMYASLTVITKRNRILCPVCGRYYELYPDGSDPGCPYCRSRTPVFTGNVMKYYTEHHTKEILKELYEGSGTYYFNDWDNLTITARNVGGSWSNKFLAFFGFNRGFVQSRYGGYIRKNGY